jgi:hypothetical protein
MPSHRHLLFLVYVPAFLERLGRPLEEQKAEEFHYIPMHGVQAVIRDLDGSARDILISQDARLPDGFEGEPFEAVVDRASNSPINSRRTSGKQPPTAAGRSSKARLSRATWSVWPVMPAMVEARWLRAD